VRLTGPIKVLIVDDSPLVRSALTRVLSKARGITVVGGAKDAFEAREIIIAFRPDVIILDSELPRMDGLTFLGKLMSSYPVPVIMCCDAGESRGQLALKAVEMGAVDVVAKPLTVDRRTIHQLGAELIEKIQAAAIAIKRPTPGPSAVPQAPTSFHDAGLDPTRYLVVIGASTGGTEAIKNLLSNVPADFPPTAIVQHMPEGFTNSFAGRLDHFSRVAVTEAVDGDILVPGRAFLARGGVQMAIRHSGGKWRIAYGTNELVNRHCPSVDVLFDSCIRASGVQMIGILLTGMGSDGAQGLLRMRRAGAITIAQDQRSCVVYGMPKVAAELGAVQHTGSPTQIPAMLLHVLRHHIAEPAMKST
jgi:two-component system, chemotaxis family, protein-glutamate methylesterase/glutaminase